MSGNGTMKRNLLSRLRSNGLYYLIGALLLLLGIPLYQSLFLAPLGYSSALMATSTGHFSAYLTWISNHSIQFIIYRILLVAAFASLLTLPFSLFRIIVAQEIMGQQERAEEEQAGEEADGEEVTADEPEDEEQSATEAMPPYAWRGKGFAVIAAWAGLFGLIAYILGTVASTLYLVIVSSGFTPNTPVPSAFSTFSSIFSIITNTVGVGLLALATLFFGAIIARSGRNLWPDVWIAFGYAALAVAALLSGSAVAVTTAPTAGQATLTAPAVLLFSLWVLWLGFMLMRLKPEA
jgi:hypothetical protein